MRVHGVIVRWGGRARAGVRERKLGSSTVKKDASGEEVGSIKEGKTKKKRSSLSLAHSLSLSSSFFFPFLFFVFSSFWGRAKDKIGVAQILVVLEVCVLSRDCSSSSSSSRGGVSGGVPCFFSFLAGVSSSRRPLLRRPSLLLLLLLLFFL